MSTMIEKVAKTLERKYNPQWTDEQFETWWNEDAFFCKLVTGWQDGFRGTRKQRRMYEATLAIAAMREPTDAMYVKGDECIIEALNDHTFVFREKTPAYDCWETMIDAALSE